MNHETEKSVEILEKTTAYEGYFRIDRYRLRHRRFDGGWTRDLMREVFERGHAAGVLLYDPDRDMVVLIEQFRPGAFAAGLDPWLIEIVAGIIDAGETPDGVVRREAREEADRAVTDLKPIGTCLLSPGGSTETCALFLGRVDAREAGGVHGLEHEGEDIRVLPMPADEAFALIDSGRINNAITLISLQWLRVHRDAVRKEWA